MSRVARTLLILLLVAAAAGQERPNLTGTYDVSTLTPLQRPPALGQRLEWTDEEAEEVARKEAAMIAERDAVNPTPTAPPAGENVGNYNRFWFARGSEALRIKGNWRTSIIVDPPNGRQPPKTPEGKRRAAERAKMNRPNADDAWWIEEGLEPGPFDDPELRSTAERCLLSFGSVSGPPTLPAAYNNLKKIVQTDEHVLLYMEMIHDARIVRMNAEHAPDDLRFWLGDSVGRWEGDVLVVDTTNFNDTPALMGASRDLHVVERFSRLDDQTLLYRFTVDDPTIWTRPWTGEYVWKATEDRIYEYACHEGNYSFGGILRGARLLEEEALR